MANQFRLSILCPPVSAFVQLSDCVRLFLLVGTDLCNHDVDQPTFFKCGLAMRNSTDVKCCHMVKKSGGGLRAPRIDKHSKHRHCGFRCSGNSGRRVQRSMLEPGLKLSRINGCSLLDARRNTRAMLSTRRLGATHKLSLPEWHKPHGEALLATEPRTLAKLLAASEI
jgi:hypothetical protein